MARRNYERRCGACCEGSHEDCVVQVWMNTSRGSASKQPGGPYAWKCQCACREWIDEVQQSVVRERVS